MSCNSGVIVLVNPNLPCATHSSDLQLLVRYYFLNCTPFSHITIIILISHPNFVAFASGFTDCKKSANLIINNWYYFIIRSKRKKLRVTLSVCVQKSDVDKLLLTNVFFWNISGTWSGRTVLYLTKFLWSSCLCTEISRRHFLTVFTASR